MKDHISYYKNIIAIPTLNIGDLKKKIIYNQRKNFYLKIGITELDFYKKKVLELCPGTGYNALYLADKCKIKSITLVDNNEESIKNLKKNLKKIKNKKIIYHDVFKFNTNLKYDFVILENAIGGFDSKNSNAIISKLKKYTKKGGRIILNFPNINGIFLTKLKYFYSIMLLENSKFSNFKSKLNILTKIFEPHQKYLSINSRNSKKWVLDNILNQDYMRKKFYFNFLNIKKHLNKNFFIIIAAPNFYKDFIWYKNFNEIQQNKNIINQLTENELNFIDFETMFHKTDDIANIRLKKINNLISNFSFDKKINSSKIKFLKIEIIKLSRDLNNLKKNNKISKGLNEFISWISIFEKGKKIPTKSKYFHKLHGIQTSCVCILKS